MPERLAGAPAPTRTLCQGRRSELCVACPRSGLLTPAPTSPSYPPHPPASAFLGWRVWEEEARGLWGAGGAWIPASVYLPKKTGRARGHARGGPSTGACLPPALPHTDTGPAWGAAECFLLVERLPSGGHPVGERATPPPAKSPGGILPRLFIPYSVTFLFYFTLIMIIQEYYLR